MNNEIGLKWNGLKYYNFTDEFMAKYKEETTEFINLWDEYFNDSICCWGAEEKNKEKKELKIKICESVCKLYNLGVAVQNNWNDTYYNNENDIRNYLMDGVNNE